MVGHLHQAGMQVVPDAAQADVVIVNTCSFIDSSKQESISHILEAHEQRRPRASGAEGQEQIVADRCLSQRFSRDLPGRDAGGRRLHRPGPDNPRRTHHRGTLRQGARPTRPSTSFVTPRSATIPDHDTPRFRRTPHGISRTSRSPRAAIIPAPSASSRRSAGDIAAGRSPAWRPRPAQLVAEGRAGARTSSPQDTTFFGMDTWEERPNPRTPVDSSRGTALTTLLHAAPGDRGRFLGPAPLHPSKRTGSDRLILHDRGMPQGRPLRGHAAPAHQRPHARDDAAGDERRLHPGPGPADPRRHSRDRPPHHLHRRLSRRDRRRRERALRLHPRGEIRAPGGLSFFPGGGHAGRQDAGARFPPRKRRSAGIG